jgi:hypothetical protein
MKERFVFYGKKFLHGALLGLIVVGITISHSYTSQPYKKVETILRETKLDQSQPGKDNKSNTKGIITLSTHRRVRPMT